MGVTLYHFPPSAASRGAFLAANAVGIDIDVQNINLFEKEQLKPEFVKVNIVLGYINSIPVCCINCKQFLILFTFR